MDNVRKELVEVKNCTDWKVKYGKEVEQYLKEHPSKSYIGDNDKDMYERYLKVLGTKYIPNNIINIMELKKR